MSPSLRLVVCGFVVEPAESELSSFNQRVWEGLPGFLSSWTKLVFVCFVHEFHSWLDLKQILIPFTERPLIVMWYWNSLYEMRSIGSIVLTLSSHCSLLSLLKTTGLSPCIWGDPTSAHCNKPISRLDLVWWKTICPALKNIFNPIKRLEHFDSLTIKLEMNWNWGLRPRGSLA